MNTHVPMSFFFSTIPFCTACGEGEIRCFTVENFLFHFRSLVAKALEVLSSRVFCLALRYFVFRSGAVLFSKAIPVYRKEKIGWTDFVHMETASLFPTSVHAKGPARVLCNSFLQVENFLLIVLGRGDVFPCPC